MMVNIYAAAPEVKPVTDLMNSQINFSQIQTGLKRQLTEIEGLSDQYVGDYWEKFASRKVRALYGKRASTYHLRGEDFEKSLKSKKCSHHHSSMIETEQSHERDDMRLINGQEKGEGDLSHHHHHTEE